MTAFTESVVEDAALAWLEGLGYAVLHGPDIAAGEPGAERSDPNYRDVVLEGRLRAGAGAPQPGPAGRGARGRLPQAHARRRAVAGRAQPRRAPDAGGRRDGRVPPRRTAPSPARRRGCIDFDDPDEQRLAGRQPVHRGRGPAQPAAGRRPLRQRPAAGGHRAQEPGRRERHDLDAPSSSSRPTRRRSRRCSPTTRRWSSPTACRRGSARSAPARSGSSPGARSTGESDAPADHARAAGRCCEGVFEQAPLPRPAPALHRLRGRRAAATLVKKMAGYHQFHAVNVAVEETLRAAQAQPGVRETPGRYEAGQQPGGEPGDRRVGVVWHTQGSGKSLTMAFYAGRVILHPAMENPTIVVLTDRNDLDDQLFGTFARCQELLRQPPVQAADRADLREKLRGGLRRRGLHHHPEVLPRGEGRPAPGALGPAQHRRHRRRGPPQPVRLHRRLRPAHARRAAQRLLHRLHRHAHRADRREHPRRLRRLHQRLRHPAGGRGRRHGAHLLREPAGQAGARRSPSGRRSTPSSRR